MSDAPENPSDDRVLTVEDLDRFEELLAAAVRQMDELTIRLDLIKTKAESAATLAEEAKETNATGRKLLYAGFVGIVLAICLAIGAIIATRAANRQAEAANQLAESNQVLIDEILAVRTEARRVTCNNHNDFLDAVELKVNSAAPGAIIALVPGVTSPDQLDPETRAKYDAYVAALEADHSLDPLRRDCSNKEAIDAWYEANA